MSFLKKEVLPILVATLWVSISEFARNETFLKPYWIEHYEDLGLVFPSEPVNGAVWGIWSLFYAISISIIISKRFSLIETTLLAWLVGFVLMWIVTANMGVLPLDVLWFAVPLSILEAFVAAFIIFKLGAR